MTFFTTINVKATTFLFVVEPPLHPPPHPFPRTFVFKTRAYTHVQNISFLATYEASTSKLPKQETEILNTVMTCSQEIFVNKISFGKQYL